MNTLVVGLLLAALLVARRALKTRPPVVPPPAGPAIPTGRPVTFSFPLFNPVRGAHRTTQEAAYARMAANPGPMFDLAGLCYPAREYLNRLLFVTGLPSSGKTTLCKMLLVSLGRLFAVLRAQSHAGLYPGRGQMRWLVTDPTNAFLPLLYRVTPPDVPVVRLSPHDAGGVAWDIAADVTNEVMNEALQRGLFPDSAKGTADPFWTFKGREVSKSVVSVFLHRQSVWTVRDMVVPLKYPQFLRSLLEQNPRTRGMVKHELVGRLGRDITATSSATINQFAIAAALWAKAGRKYSMKEFLDQRAVAHFAFTPHMAAALAGVANAMTYVLILEAIKRNEEFNHTLLIGDEARYLNELVGLEDLAARGRGAGLGAVLLAQGLPGLTSSWGEKRVKELLDLVNTWVCLRAGPDTAEAFSRHVGVVEGIQKSYSYSSTYSRSETYTTSRGGGSSSSFGQYSSNSNWGESKSVTSGTSYTYGESFALHTKPAVLPSELTNLPLASPEADAIHGFAFGPDVGVFQFTTPFLSALDDCPPAPFDQMPVRPDCDQLLQPWTLEDLRRLKLDLTPAFLKALRITWGRNGGVP
jgi:hypothetical protein